MDALFEEHNIKKNMCVKLERNFIADSASYLQHASNQTIENKNRPKRRVSVASTQLFEVGNSVREVGFDYLERIPRSTRVNFGLQSNQASGNTSGISFGVSNLARVNFVADVGIAARQDEPNNANENVPYTVNQSIGNVGTNPTTGTDVGQNEPITTENDQNEVSDPLVGYLNDINFDDLFDSYELDLSDSQTSSTAIVDEQDQFDENDNGNGNGAEEDAVETINNYPGIEVVQMPEEAEPVTIVNPVNVVTGSVDENDGNDSQTEYFNLDDFFALAISEVDSNVNDPITTVNDGVQGQFDEPENGHAADNFIEAVGTINNYPGISIEVVQMPDVTGTITECNFADEQDVPKNGDQDANVNVLADVDDIVTQQEEPNNANELIIETVHATTGTDGEQQQQRPQKIQNDFDPFRRLENIPFGLYGRRRAMSVDVNVQPFQPIDFQYQQLARRQRRQSFMATLEPILEEELDFGDDIENLFR